MSLTKRIVAFVLVATMLASLCTVFASASASATLTWKAGHAIDNAVWYDKYDLYGSSSKHTEATTTLTFKPSDGYIPMAFIKNAGWASVLKDHYAEATGKYGYEVAGLINGSFFSMADGTLSSNLISNGKVTCAHVDHSDALIAFDSNGNMNIVDSCLKFTLRFNGNEIPNGLAYLNKRHDVCGDWGNNRFFYYDTSCGSKSDSKVAGYEIICEKVDNSELAVGKTLFGKVLEIKKNTYGSAFGTSGQISNKFVLFVQNGSDYCAYAESLKVGDSVTITTTETVEASREIMENANSVIACIGWLVKNGVDMTDSQSTIGTHSVTLNTRWTAIGRRADGAYVFFTSEGGSTGDTSRGLHLKDVAAAMIKLGCVDVIRFDGGGSTGMYVSNTGSGSAGYVTSSTRADADCILVVKKSSLVDATLNNTLKNLIAEAKANNPSAEESAIIAEAEALLASATPISGDVKRYLMELSPMSSLGRALVRAGNVNIADYNPHILNELRTVYDEACGVYYSGNTSADVKGYTNQINALLAKTSGTEVVSLGASYTASAQNRINYLDDGKLLTDGVKGADGGVEGVYAGWSASNEVIVDLGSAKATNKYSIYLAAGAWGIAVPEGDMIKLDVYASDSKNGTYTLIGSSAEAKKTGGTGKNDESWSTYEISVNSDADVKKRYIKFVITNNWGGHIWLGETEASYQNKNGAYVNAVTDHIYVTKFNQSVLAGDCIIYTPDFGTITDANSNHRWTTNALLEWSDSANAYVLKSMATAAGTAPSVTLTSKQLYIACHSDPSVPGSDVNMARLLNAKIGQKMLTYGVNIADKSKGIAAYIKFIDANATDPDLELTCEHNYKAVVTKPTCTEGGYTTYTCADCGDSYIDDRTTATGHKAGAAATCTTAQTCTVCGETLKAATGHKAGAAATCETAQTCTVCGKTLKAATGHKAGAAATCTTAQTCTVCGKTLKAALGHKAGAGATCTEPQTCTVCGEVINAAGGHSYKSVVTKPTCTSKGYTTYTCEVCGDSYTGDTVLPSGHKAGAAATCTTAQTCTVCGETLKEALGHKYTTVVTKPTCTDEGYTTYTCSKCGDSYVDDEVAALGHKYASVVTKPTCTEGGYTTYTCSACGDSYVDNKVDALGHDYDAVVTKPTCTEGGYTTYTCSVCGDSYVDDEVAALGHKAGAGATCTEPQVCTVCGEVINAAGGHTYVGVVTEAGCTSAGYTTYTCSVCGDSYIGDRTMPAGHKPSAAADCENAQVCTVCGYVFKAALGHKPGAEADCENDQVCTVCDKVLVEALGHTPGAEADCENDQVCTVCDKVLVEALGHTPGAEADCVNDQICTVCGEVLVPSSGHNYKAVVTKPTCTEGGYTTYTCPGCGDSYVDDEVAALGHDYDVVVTEATCTEGGYTTHTCSVCGDSYVDNVVDALGHTPGAEADCENDQVCTVCDEVLVPAFGHVEGEWIEDENGNREKYCEVCGKLLELEVNVPEEYDTDVNGDGKLNIFDYAIVKMIYFDIEMDDPDYDMYVVRSDVNRDGVVNVFDYAMVKMAYFGKLG